MFLPRVPSKLSWMRLFLFQSVIVNIVQNFSTWCSQQPASLSHVKQSWIQSTLGHPFSKAFQAICVLGSPPDPHPLHCIEPNILFPAVQLWNLCRNRDITACPASHAWHLHLMPLFPCSKSRLYLWSGRQCMLMQCSAVSKCFHLHCLISALKSALNLSLLQIKEWFLFSQ